MFVKQPVAQMFHGISAYKRLRFQKALLRNFAFAFKAVPNKEPLYSRSGKVKLQEKNCLMVLLGLIPLQVTVVTSSPLSSLNCSVHFHCHRTPTHGEHGLVKGSRRDRYVMSFANMFYFEISINSQEAAKPRHKFQGRPSSGLPQDGALCSQSAASRSRSRPA